jgi:hypothetical protein
VKNRFRNLPFKCNLQRYIAGAAAQQPGRLSGIIAVGLCTLNQVDP